ncbi:LLM class flavin-dependent oxidoreductase [Euzebya tangerina]|uniref:LLM class flavin-dependent oxidoreductase n=1 Tax=Euzebya tangerina TaxID=591198 RepID=UPI000E31A377|nr:LLM class flavin-dependent oxidoreductase [Euzebya tangerina]
MTLRFGLVLPIQSIGDDIPTLVDQLRAEVQAAEAAGFDAVFLTEFHQARGGALVSPLLVGAGLLAGTSRIRFGTAVVPTPLHHPVRLAEDVVMLDHMSRGRVILGLGIGHQPPDFRLFGVDRSARVSRTEEAIAVLEQCFSGQPFSHSGEHFEVTGQVTPAPYTAPRPPIWMGAHSAPGLDRSARLADLWLCDPERHIDVVARLAEQYRARCAVHGTTPRVGLFREAWIADSAAECEAEWAPHAMQVHRLYYNVGVYLEEFEPWVTQVQSREDFTLDLLGPGRFLYGSPDEVRATVTEWVGKTGAEYLALRLRHPGGPGHDATLSAIRRFGAEVIGPLGAGVVSP